MKRTVVQTLRRDPCKHLMKHRLIGVDPRNEQKSDLEMYVHLMKDQQRAQHRLQRGFVELAVGLVGE